MAFVSASTPTNLFEVVERLARDEPQRVALISPARGAQTCSELREGAGRLAASFFARGIGRGDRVLVMAPPRPELYLVVLALMKLAATAVFVEPALGIGHLIGCSRAARPRAFVGTLRARLLLRATGTSTDVPLTLALDDLPGDEAPAVAIAPTGDETPALITYTSGTGGAPKATSRTHALLWAQHRALIADFPYREGDRILTGLPLFALHDLAAGAGVVLPALRAGTALEPVAARVVRQIVAHDVTLIRGGPRFCAGLARYCASRGLVLSGVRALFTGGAPVPVTLVEELRRLLPDGEVYVVYGSTEAEPIAAATGDDLIDLHALTSRGFGVCAGKPVGGASVRILADGSATGEVAVTGRHVNHGGWHLTGDTGYLDDRGRLWLTGRVTSTVRRAGKRLQPLRIEPVVDALPFVARSALLGVPDRELGERAVLVVAPRRKGLSSRVFRSGAWRAEVDRACRSVGIEVDEIRFARTIPLDRRHRAKIRYDRVRAWYERPALLRALT
jgi:acyl-CoA synthetase (AMP-forming)/AMP-acid ligase II